jgi:hypothetical protein
VSRLQNLVGVVRHPAASVQRPQTNSRDSSAAWVLSPRLTSFSLSYLILREVTSLFPVKSAGQRQSPEAPISVIVALLSAQNFSKVYLPEGQNSKVFSHKKTHGSK